MKEFNAMLTHPVTAEQVEVLNRIRRNIKRSEDEYALYFVECNLPNLRRQLIDELDSTDNLNLLTLNIADYPIDEGLHIDEWINKQKNKCQNEKPKQLLDGINIIGLEQLLPTDSDEQIIKTVSELNWRRSYFQALAVPIIFWLPSYALALLANQASDFYDWYSDIYHFESDLEQKKFAVLQQVSSLRHPKSSIAAHQYQSKTEKEKQLRHLYALLDETRNLDDTATIQNQIGLLLFSIGRQEKAFSCFQCAYDIYRDINNRIGMASTLSNISQILISKGDYSSALDSLKTSLEIIKANKGDIGLGATLNNIGQVYSSIGNHEKALYYYNFGLKTCEQYGDRIGIGSALNNIASIYYDLGEYNNALDYFERSLKTCEEISDKLGLGTSLNNIASIYEIRKDYDKALVYFKRSLNICKEIGNRPGIATALSNIANMYQTWGDYNNAINYYKKSLIIDEETENITGMGLTFNNMAQIYSNQGDHIVAIDYFRKSIDISRAVNDKVGLAYSYYNLGSVLQKSDPDLLVQDNKYFIQAYDLAKELNLKEILSIMNKHSYYT